MKKVYTIKGLSYGTFPTSLPMDEQFTALSPQAQLTYMMLWLDESSTHVGTRFYYSTALAQRMPGLREDDVVVAAEELASNGWITLDEDEELVHLRGWMAYDGLTSSKNMGKPVRSAWNAVESPTIRESILNDLALAYEIDKGAAESGRSSRSESSRRSAANAPKDPDREEGFWTHDLIEPIAALMPVEPVASPLAGHRHGRPMPMAFGRPEGREKFARLGWLNMWVFLTLYLRANDAGVYLGPPQRLRRRATGPEMTSEGMRVAVRDLAQNGWVEQATGTSGSATRIRFFHLHEHSPLTPTRGSSVGHAIADIADAKLQAGAISDLALALTCGITLPKRFTGKKSFWSLSRSAGIWDGFRPRAYDLDDLTEHCIGPELPKWVGTPVPKEQFPWVPRHTIIRSETPSTYALTETNTGTLTETHEDTLTGTLTPQPLPHEQGEGGVTDTLTGTHNETLTDTCIARSYELGVRSYPSEGSRSALDGRTDGHSSADAEYLAAEWADTLGNRNPQHRISVGNHADLIHLAASWLTAGRTVADLDGIVAEVLARPGVRDPGGYLLSVLADGPRPPRPPATGAASPSLGAPAHPAAPQDPFARHRRTQW